MLVCRTCLTRKDLSPLFGELSASKFDSFQLYIATGTQIKQNDGLPQTACKSCVKTIRSILHFREISEKTQQILHSLTWNIKKENDSSQRSIYQDVIDGNELKHHSWNGVHNSNNETKNIPPHTINIEERNEILKKKLKIPTREFKIENTTLCNYQNISENNTDSNDTENIDKIFNLKKELTIEDLESDSEVESSKCLDFNLGDTPIERKTVWVTVAGTTDNSNSRYTNKAKEKIRIDKQKIFNKKKGKNQIYMALAVDPNSRPMECQKCHKRLKDRSSFIYHAKTHFEPEFSCEMCGKKFRSRNHMGYHQQRRHGRMKRLACSQCGYRAVDKTTLLNHERLEHTGERPFTCDECGNSFRMRRAIVQHMKRHFGIKNQQCDRCPEMFKSASELWSHQDRVHLMNYTYPCYLCSETYKCGAAVKKHLLNVHGLPIEQQLKVKCVKIKK